MTPEENGFGYKELPPVKADESMPSFLVQEGFRAGSTPKIRIRGSGGGSYNFKFDAPIWPGVLPEQIEDLLPQRGATGSPGYVQREARKFLDEILSGQFECRKRRTA